MPRWAPGAPAGRRFAGSHLLSHTLHDWDEDAVGRILGTLCLVLTRRSSAGVELARERVDHP